MFELSPEHNIMMDSTKQVTKRYALCSLRSDKILLIHGEDLDWCSSESLR